MTIVGLEMQEWFAFILLSSYKIFYSAVNDINMVATYAHKDTEISLCTQ